MKKLAVLALTAFITTSAFASDYSCKSEYETRINHLTHSEHQSEKNIQYIVVGSAVTESLLFNTTIVAGSLTVYTPVSIGIFLGLAGWQFYKTDKVNSHLTAQSIIEESFVGKSEVEARDEAAYYSLQNYKAKKKLAKLNKKARKAGKAEQSLEDYLAQNPIPTFNKSSVKTPLTTLTNNLNKDRTDKLSYDSVAEIVQKLSQDKTFCPDGIALGKRNLQKVVESNI